MTSTEKLARRIDRLEAQVTAVATQPRLRRSSLDGGALELRDADGNVAGYVGQQFDGSVGTQAVGGTPLPSPTMPLVEPEVGGVRIYWDGTWVDGSVTRSDFSRVTFHAVLNPDDLDVVSPTQIVGEITTATGGECSATLSSEEWLFYAVAWTQAGKFSVESDPAFATPLPIVDPAMWKAHEDALAELDALDLTGQAEALDNLQNVALPNLQDRLAANDTLLEELSGGQTALQEAADAAQAAADAAATDAQSAVDDALAALAVAGSAQAAADGAIRTYGPEEYPVNPPWPNNSTQPASVVGDLWLDDDGVAHRWNGTVWYVIPDSAAANALAKAIEAQGKADDAAADALAAYERWAPTGAVTIDGGKLTADSVTSTQIKARTIVALDIAADTLTANEMAADTITANEIAAETITGDEIAANAIGASKISIGDLTNYIADGNLLRPTLDGNWDNGGNVLTRVQPAGQPAYIEWTVNTGNHHRYNSNRFEVTGGALGVGDEFYFECEVSTPSTNTASVTITGAIQIWNAAGAAIGWPNAGAKALPINTGWTPYSGIIRITDPAAEMGVFDPFASSTVAGQKVRMRSMTLRKRAAGKLLVDGTITGTQIAGQTITGDNILGASITGDEIAGNTIKGIHIVAGSIDADAIDTDVLQAGFTLTGRLQVGSSYWTPGEGIVIPSAGGGITRFPSDGVTPATVSGHLNAKSLTIEGDMSLNGNTNQVQGSLTLSNGISRPLVAPAVYQSWDGRYVELFDNKDTAWQIQQGLCEKHASTTQYASAVNFGGGTIRFIDKNTGAWGGDLPDPNGWGNNFIPYGGVAYASSAYYVFGTDYNRGGGWYAYRIDANNGAKLAEIYTGPPGTFGSGVRIAANAGNGRVYLAWCHQSSGVATLRHWDLSLNYLTDQTFNGFGSGVYRSFTGLYVGTADVGEQRIWVVSKEDRTVLCFRLSDNGYFSGESFPVAGSATPFGLTYDTNLNKFTSFDNAGNLYRYSSQRTAKTVTATYTWYDGTGTVRETQPSPVTTFNLPPRAYINVETSVPPDSGVTDPARVDKANRVGIYVGLDGAARRRQSYLGVDGAGVSIRKLTLDTVATGLNLEPTTNGFTGGQTSPGQLMSAAGGFVVNGDGSGAWPAVRPAGEITAWAGATAPTGWLLCQGQSLLRADYPALLAVIGTAYGAVDATHFSLPNMQGRVIVGRSTLGDVEFDGLGETGGVKSVQLTAAQSGMPLTNAVVQSSGAGYYFNTPGSTGAADRATLVGPQNAAQAHTNLQPYITVNYIIKT